MTSRLFGALVPELPEVETIVRSLCNSSQLPFNEGQGMNTRPGVLGREITSAQVFWAKTLAVPELHDFEQRIMGQRVTAVERRGKFLLLRLTRDTLLIHLRMSGDIRVEATVAPLQIHDRLTLNFSDETRLVFNDTRKFGRAWLVADPASVLGALGYEPFDPALTGEVLLQKVSRSARRIKTLLLDQTVLAGVGNIYSDEALHRARVNPALTGREINIKQADDLLDAIRSVLAEGIERNGASIDWVYRGGEFQNHFRVYQRSGEPCLVCGTKIERCIIGQRSTHFCPTCQPLRDDTPK